MECPAILSYTVVLIRHSVVVHLSVLLQSANRAKTELDILSLLRAIELACMYILVSF